jgi:hypothetical protein
MGGRIEKKRDNAEAQRALGFAEKRMGDWVMSGTRGYN